VDDGIATGYGLDGRVPFPAGAGVFLFSTVPRPALGLTQHPIQWVPGVKRLGHEADYSSPPCAEVNNTVAIPPPSHISSRRGA
jgi:hypothetical protein